MDERSWGITPAWSYGKWRPPVFTRDKFTEVQGAARFRDDIPPLLAGHACSDCV